MSELSTIEGTPIEDLTTYPTRAEVADRLNCSVSKVRALERAGILRPIVDAEGTHRFHPWDVQRAAAPGEGAGAELASPEARAAQYAALDLTSTSRLLNAVLGRVERLDAFMASILDRQAKRIGELERLMESRHETLVELERARAHDRIAEEQVRREGQLLERATDRLLSTGERFAAKMLGLPAGTPFLASLTVEQLRGMAEVPDVWTPAQLQAIRGQLAQAEGAGVDSSGSSAPKVPADEKETTP